MIRHVVFFSAKRQADLETIYNGLMLLKDIPHATFFEVGRNFGSDRLSETQIDFIVYAQFASNADLAAYKAHPIYQQAIDIVRPLRDLRIAADFLSSQSPSLEFG